MLPFSVDMNNSEKSDKQFGIRHWLFQAAPPMLLLMTLYGTARGSALVYAAGLFAIPALISFVSMILKLLDLRNRKHYLLRPALTIIFFCMILLIAQLSYGVALREAANAAEILHQQCISELSCPTEPIGWKKDGRRIFRQDLGTVYKYSASYLYDAEVFYVRVSQGPDLGHTITGGVDTPLSVSRYVKD